ncbi:phage baseplate assembly protein gpV [Ewingella americana]
MTGNISHSGGGITSNGIVLHTHKHGGVQTGGGQTQVPQ